MELHELVKELQSSGYFTSELCTYFPQLVIENIENVDKKFSATYDEESGYLELEGALRNSIEINALRQFLEFIGPRTNDTDKVQTELTNSKCQCGEDNWKYIGKVDSLLTPEAGHIYHILQCNACKRYFTLPGIIR